MKKALSIISCIITLLCFVACGDKSDIDSQTETTTEPTEKAVVEVEPLNEEDFLALCANESEEINFISKLDEYGDGKMGAEFAWYDPNYDESKEGVIRTHRGIVLGDTKEKVIEKYGDGKNGDFDIDNDYCYEVSKDVNITDSMPDTSDVSAVMSAQCVSYVRYTFKDKYTISFYFDENDEVSWIFYTKKE